MPRPKPIEAPPKLWIIRGDDGKPAPTPEGTWFDTQGDAERVAKALGKSKRSVQPYGRIDPKPRGRNANLDEADEYHALVTGGR